jgi:hypothetical protein
VLITAVWRNAGFFIFFWGGRHFAKPRYASKKDLNRALVYYTRPILDSIKYKFAVVSPLDIDKLIIDGSELSFTYKIGAKEYDRIQKYEKGKRPNDLENLQVKYRVDRPEIGYLVEIK